MGDLFLGEILESCCWWVKMYSYASGEPSGTKPGGGESSFAQQGQGREKKKLGGIMPIIASHSQG